MMPVDILLPATVYRPPSIILTIRGCKGFDGGVEAGIAGGCAYHPENGQLL